MAITLPHLRQRINCFGEYQLDLTQPPRALNYDIQVITIPAKKGKVVKMCTWTKLLTAESAF
jgi:hypothetical protein